MERRGAGDPVWTPAAPSGLTAAVAPAAGVGSGQVKLAWTAPASNNGVGDHRLSDRTVARRHGVDDGGRRGVDRRPRSPSAGSPTARRTRSGSRRSTPSGTGPSSATVTATPAGQPAAPERVDGGGRPGGRRGLRAGEADLDRPAEQRVADHRLPDRTVRRRHDVDDGGRWRVDGDRRSRRWAGQRHAATRSGSPRVNALGQGPWSAMVQATPGGSRPLPSGLTAAVAPAAGVGSGQVKLTWTGPASDNGSAITDYLDRAVPRRHDVDDGGRRRVDGDRRSSSAELANGTRYSFRVGAVNAVGHRAVERRGPGDPRGDASRARRADRGGCPGDGVGSGEVQLTWTAPRATGGRSSTTSIESSVDGTRGRRSTTGCRRRRGSPWAASPTARNYSFRVDRRNALGHGASSDTSRRLRRGRRPHPAG